MGDFPSPPPPSPVPSGPVSAWRPPPSFDEYRVIELIGRGGMGEVYRAHDEILDRPVAVKVISGIEPDPSSRERFILEARAAARLQHPNVLTVYRVGEHEGRPYLISELIRGKTLDEVETPMPWQRVLELAVGLARGLSAAHRRGVLHRDIKPSNAILTDEGEVKLLDFGLAKLLDGAGRAEPADPGSHGAAVEPAAGGGAANGGPCSLPPGAARGGTLVSICGPAGTPVEDGRKGSGAGALMGTPDYMAPELWRGEPATRRSDVYALGALLFELCAGHPPHRQEAPRSLPVVVQKRDAPLLTAVAPQVSPKLAAVVERCLRRDPGERFASGDEVREALEQLALTVRSGVVPAGNPYRGLHSFEAEHRAIFFGRHAEVGTLLERLRVEPLVVVAGDSGVGKSSLCRAGVLPAVADGALEGGRNWSVVRFVPGRAPLLALGGALGPLLGLDDAAVIRRLRANPTSLAHAIRKRLGEAAGLVLFVDQLEELVTMADPAGTALVGEALGHLATGLPGVRLLMTVRSDFLAPVAAIPHLGDEIAQALYFLKPLSAEGIREAITGPARATGVAFESEALVDTLVESTATAEGGLPLLQFALAELWEVRGPGAITAAALEKIGGVTGALARHVDEVILGMTAVQRSAARRVLFALVGPQGTPVRRRGDELVTGDEAARIALNALVVGRLLVVRNTEQGPTYELAHEALLRGYSTLRRWLDEQAGSRAVHQRLVQASAEWERLGRSREQLWTARQLSELRLIEPDDLLPREAAFVAASRAAQVRVKLGRVAALALAAVVGAASCVGLKIQDHHRVTRFLDEAQHLLEEGDRAFDVSEGLRRTAFSRFDGLARDEGEALWARSLPLAVEADHRFAQASQVLESALAFDPRDARVQDLLGDVLLSRVLLAEREHRREQQDELLRRLALYDAGGARRRSLSAPAQIDLDSVPSGARVTIEKYEEDAGRVLRLVEPRDPGPTPIQGYRLAPGSYLLTLSLPGRAPTRYPILLERAERFVRTIPLPEAARVPEGFVYVAPGRFLFGSTATEETRGSFYSTAPLHVSHTEAFLIAAHEVTYEEWIAFLRTLTPEERLRRAPRIQGLTGALELKELPDESWQLSLQPTRVAYTARAGEKIRYEGRETRAEQDWLRFPVSGISPEDAQAYVGWLAAAGRVPGARLCTEGEWERAARGADDREFPHGNRVEPDDADIDQTYGKKPPAFGPDEVGSHPASRSPFGLDDMCGNVFEWTKSSLVLGEHVLRGGGFYYDATTARIPNRQVPEPTIHDANLGLRVCATIDP